MKNAPAILTDHRSISGDTLYQDNKDFQEGDFGIHFKDKPVDTPTTNVQIFDLILGQNTPAATALKSWTTMWHVGNELSADFLNFNPVYDTTNGQVLASQSTVGYLGLTFADDYYIGSDGNEWGQIKGEAANDETVKAWRITA
jgi:hypothetical protein